LIVPGAINGTLEFLAGLFALGNCRVLYRDKIVRGVSISSIVFFTSWGFWNLYYYPYLNQWLSFLGAWSIVLANSLWIAMLIYYRLIRRAP
jgi:hypothetical protein